MAKQPDKDWREQVIRSLPTMEANSTAAAAGFTPAPENPQPLNFAGAHTSPLFDPIDGLPPEAADKQRALRQRSDDAHAIIPGSETIREASMAKIDAANALKHLTDHPQEFGKNLPPDHPLSIEATKVLEKATADFERLKQSQEVRAAAWQSASQAKAACETWLKSGRPGNTTLAEVEIEPPKLNKGEGILDGVSGCAGVAAS